MKDLLEQLVEQSPVLAPSLRSAAACRRFEEGLRETAACFNRMR